MNFGKKKRQLHKAHRTVQQQIKTLEAKDKNKPAIVQLLKQIDGINAERRQLAKGAEC